VIQLSSYHLSSEERGFLESLLGGAEVELSLEDLWKLMDAAWNDLKCNNQQPQLQKLSQFYNHPVWLLNGIFIEQHALSMEHRLSITEAIRRLNPCSVVDFGGGFGTLARLIASSLPQCDVVICEPYPPAHGIDSCKKYPNIRFVADLPSNYFDVLVCTDVLEHVLDPLALLAKLTDSVKSDGYLVIANCFYPVIACHLPCTFHLRFTFHYFCTLFGLELVGSCSGSHASIYRKPIDSHPRSWFYIRTVESASKAYFAVHQQLKKLKQLVSRKIFCLLT
jgi:2-polyprenyl-3-methyl-5-hydroxy-6-metoxy-1,4-benzoquinol methylase